MGEGVEMRGPEDAPSVEALQAALAAQRAALREVEHRAKNSLQLVCSLLQLLGRRTPNEETRAALKSMAQRINAIAAVHRDFMDAERSDRFDLTRFVREQAPALAQSVGQGAVIRLDLDAVQVDARAACPLALIASELILNALRHGARAGAPPSASVRLRREGDGDGFVLSVEDEGPGPEAATAPGFGLTMVRLLAQQIAAEFTLAAAQPGSRAVVRTA